MTGQVGLAVLGCGYWGINYARIFSELPEARVVAVCDGRADRLQELAARFPNAHLTTEIDVALQQDGVDAVVVCTNAATHFDVTRRALLAGKHVLVEKPLTTISTDAEQLTELASSTSNVLMVGHTFVYNAGIRKVKEYVDESRSAVYYLYALRTNLGPIRRDVNALWDLASHDIAIFNFLLGCTPRWVSAVGAKVLRNCREDVGFITLGYPGKRDDIVGHIHVSWADPHKAREVVVVGSDRRIVFNDLNGSEQVRIFEKGVKPADSEPESYGEYHVQIRDGDILSPRIEVSEPLKNQCRHFLECITKNVAPLTGGQEGQDVVRVLEAADHSLSLHGAPVEVVHQECHERRRSALSFEGYERRRSARLSFEGYGRRKSA